MNVRWSTFYWSSLCIYGGCGCVVDTYPAVVLSHRQSSAGGTSPADFLGIRWVPFWGQAVGTPFTLIAFILHAVIVYFERLRRITALKAIFAIIVSLSSCTSGVCVFLSLSLSFSLSLSLSVCVCVCVCVCAFSLTLPSVHHPPCVDASRGRRSPRRLFSSGVSRHRSPGGLEHHARRLSAAHNLWGGYAGIQLCTLLGDYSGTSL